MVSFDINEIHIMEQAWKDSSHIKINAHTLKVHHAEFVSNLTQSGNKAFKFVEVHCKPKDLAIGYGYNRVQGSVAAIYPGTKLESVDDFIVLVARSTKRCKANIHRLTNKGDK